MSPLSLRCIRASLVFLALGIALGATFGIDRALGARLRPLHAELNLWGCTTLLIYGFAYHMLPRFAGQPLRPLGLAHTQSWLAIAGVACAAGGWLAGLANPLAASLLRGLGGLLQLCAASLFVVLMSKVLSRQRPQTTRAG